MDDLVERVKFAIDMKDDYRVNARTNQAKAALAVVAEWLEMEWEVDPRAIAAIRQQIGGAGKAKESGDGG